MILNKFQNIKKNSKINSLTFKKKNEFMEGCFKLVTPLYLCGLSSSPQAEGLYSKAHKDPSTVRPPQEHEGG